ncbi:dehydrogenase [Desulfoluna limicola]|uniref:Dehydrogenase n=1 Tax=Desulfoluna limicola TaxID=2810562 RepID=A0ABN6F1G5_9BACT|nr:molecular chaperone TorD family protein [Desulfoluna limicola]BCS95167.1 dehydrogenase [Desulfoluna limicola]
MKTDDILLFESARKEIYKGLSTCFGLPGPHLEPVLATLEHLLTALGSEATGSVSEMGTGIRRLKDITELNVEFSRLFVGPFSQLAPPYGSVYMEGTNAMMSESTMDVVGTYRKAGLVVAESFKEPPDHIVAELEFLCFLIDKEIEALGPGTDEVPQAFLIQQKEFLTHHLGIWLMPFTEKITRHSTSPFYQNLAKAARIVVKEDIDYLNTPGLSEQAISHMS